MKYAVVIDRGGTWCMLTHPRNIDVYRDVDIGDTG
jgi:hypothetical protein